MYPPIDITAEDTKAVLRRASELSAAHSDGLDDMDLRQSYEDAVDCVFKCESIIVNLERRLKAKDERIAELEAAAGPGPSAQDELDAKDERIAGLEEKLVAMSLELASTKASEDRLQLKLTQSNSSLSALAASTHASASTQSQSLSRRYRPVSNAGARDRGGWGCLTRWGSGREVVESDEGSDEANKESFTTEATAESTDVDEAAPAAEGDVKIDNGKLEKFLEMMTGRKDEGVRFAEAPAEGPSEPQLAPPPPPPHGEVQTPSDSGRRQRRAPSRRRRELQKSSRSFLENRGVVFPVSSFEVLDKGCVTASVIKSRGANDGAGSNEEWPVMG